MQPSGSEDEDSRKRTDSSFVLLLNTIQVALGRPEESDRREIHISTMSKGRSQVEQLRLRLEPMTAGMEKGPLTLSREMNLAYLHGGDSRQSLHLEMRPTLAEFAGIGARVGHVRIGAELQVGND